MASRSILYNRKNLITNSRNGVTITQSLKCYHKGSHLLSLIDRNNKGHCPYHLGTNEK